MWRRVLRSTFSCWRDIIQVPNETKISVSRKVKADPVIERSVKKLSHLCLFIYILGITIKANTNTSNPFKAGLCFSGFVKHQQRNSSVQISTRGAQEKKKGTYGKGGFVFLLKLCEKLHQQLYAGLEQCKLANKEVLQHVFIYFGCKVKLWRTVFVCFFTLSKECLHQFCLFRALNKAPKLIMFKRKHIKVNLLDL